MSATEEKFDWRKSDPVFDELLKELQSARKKRVYYKELLANLEVTIDRISTSIIGMVGEDAGNAE